MKGGKEERPIGVDRRLAPERAQREKDAGDRGAAVVVDSQGVVVRVRKGDRYLHGKEILALFRGMKRF